MMHIKVLVNPASGNGAGKALLTQKMGEMGVKMQATDPENIDAQLKFFLAPGDILIIAGGDGTFHLVINGLYRTGLYAQIKVAILPLGTGNDLANALRYPRLSLTTLIEKLLMDVTEYNLPLWRYGRLVFCNYLSFGLDAKILSDVTRWRRFLPKNRWLTLGLYFFAGLRGLFYWRKITVEINRKKCILQTLIFCSTSSYGGGALVKKNAEHEPSLAILPIQHHGQFIQLMLTRFTRRACQANSIRTPIHLIVNTVHGEADGELLQVSADQINYGGALTLLIPNARSV